MGTGKSIVGNKLKGGRERHRESRLKNEHKRESKTECVVNDHWK
jgi:hypothetical protein